MNEAQVKAILEKARMHQALNSHVQTIRMAINEIGNAISLNADFYAEMGGYNLFDAVLSNMIAAVDTLDYLVARISQDNYVVRQAVQWNGDDE